MDKLSHKAALAFYDATREAYVLGFISWEQALHRLAFLYTLTDDPELKKKLLFIADKAIGEMSEINTIINETELVIETNISIAEYPYNYPPFYEPIILHLIVRDAGGLKKWEFHHDPDFFPSIPHGHEVSSKRKLDSYLGWIYQNSAQVGRESRKLIIALWNNDDFRSFALSSIKWYMASYPHFKWRVLNPLRIPKKRKKT